MTMWEEFAKEKESDLMKKFSGHLTAYAWMKSTALPAFWGYEIISLENMEKKFPTLTSLLINHFARSVEPTNKLTSSGISHVRSNIRECFRRSRDRVNTANKRKEQKEKKQKEG